MLLDGKKESDEAPHVDSSLAVKGQCISPTRADVELCKRSSLDLYFAFEAIPVATSGTILESHGLKDQLPR